VIQSSSATLGIAITLAGQGLLSLPAGVAVMLGAEVGTCADTLLAAIGRSREALRAGLFHLLFNVATVVVGLALVGPLAALARRSAATRRARSPTPTSRSTSPACSPPSRSSARRRAASSGCCRPAPGMAPRRPPGAIPRMGAPGRPTASPRPPPRRRPCSPGDLARWRAPGRPATFPSVRAHRRGPPEHHVSDALRSARLAPAPPAPRPPDAPSAPAAGRYDRSIVEGPLAPAVWRLAWPTMLTNVIGGLQGIVDHVLVGHLVGFAATPRSAWRGRSSSW
jgi:hypothetical protein